MQDLATILLTAGTAWYLYVDRDPKRSPSFALWLPGFWVFIGASRRVSQWISSGPVLDSPDRYLEGNPIDRAVLAILIVCGVAVLIHRGRRTLHVLSANIPVALFFLYCAVSLAWSDFPAVGAKRLMTMVGDVVMVLVVLTDVDPLAAAKRFFSRLSVVLIPISVLLVRYYGDLGRIYAQSEDGSWGMVAVGITENKNTLGLICFVFGVPAMWRFAQAFEEKRRTALAAHGAILVMAVWLLGLADSATSTGCFVFGTALILLCRRGDFSRRPARVTFFVVASLTIVVLGLYVIPEMGLLQALGRDRSLTGRTQLWQDISSLIVNPIVGTGYENFWLGDRLAILWRIHWWKPNQAHNGYFEVFLNLGIVGLCWLTIVIVRGYVDIARELARGSELAGLRLAFLVLTLFYNLSEAAFKMMNPVWIAFLFAVIAVPSVEPSVVRRLIKPRTVGIRRPATAFRYAR